MATIIQRTNPNRKIGPAGEQWQCAACGNVYDDKGEAIVCAEIDHVTGRHRRRVIEPAEYPVDLVCPPCDLDAAIPKGAK